MMRALWTGASGMTAQQTSLDTISNNLANINTNGYKKETTHFQSLLYQKIQTRVTDNEGNPLPVIGQVGLGTRVSNIVSQYTQGNLLETGNPLDLAIDGEGFFMIRMPDGSVSYTRNGAFELGASSQGFTLCTASGYPVLDSTGKEIVFNREIDTSTLEIDEFGIITYKEKVEVKDPDNTDNNNNNNTNNNTPNDTQGTENEETQEDKKYVLETRRVAVIGLAQFNNPAGLEKISGSLLKETENSGTARVEAQNPSLKRSRLLTNYLEGSNVQVASELVDLIVTQRAYQMNSKVITAADEMLQEANALRQ